MEEEFEQIEVEYAPLCEGHEIDIEYEFDAPQFFVFTHEETVWEASEAEQWFEFAPSYPPSPFLLKMRWRNCSPGTEKEQVSNVEDDNSTDSLNGKTKPLGKSSSCKGKDFSFMKPTASHLAKQKNPSEVQNPESLRFQRQTSSSTTDCPLTKRQKLEAGYLRKIARLKHHIPFTHKKAKEVDGTDVHSASKSNVTIAKEPNLVTALRAQRHKSKTNAASGGPTQSSSQELKAKPSNKKILEGPAPIFSKMKAPRPTECQVRSSLNSDSTSNSETRGIRRTNSGTVASSQEKCKTSNKLRGSRDNKEPNDKESLNEPPTELFSKVLNGVHLSLASEVKQTAKSSSKEQPMSKGSKENRPGSFQWNEKMKLLKEGMQRSCGKQYQLHLYDTLEANQRAPSMLICGNKGFSLKQGRKFQDKT
ncbi:unnamed protein product [Sphenostylis stenocarpa]|uniref:TPX2 central domain-containing protein n=1 Tax=Sphenostylis stenocarpa TaxID=92480 RepID=A0AA86STM9_9FABA|nr:unnamed protein product [Sphenostylis stenocarpa]